MLSRKNVLDFNPRKCYSLGFRVIRGMENLLSFLKSYPLFQNSGNWPGSASAYHKV